MVKRGFSGEGEGARFITHGHRKWYAMEFRLRSWLAIRVWTAGSRSLGISMTAVEEGRPA